MDAVLVLVVEVRGVVSNGVGDWRAKGAAGPVGLEDRDHLVLEHVVHQDPVVRDLEDLQPRISRDQDVVFGRIVRLAGVVDAGPVLLVPRVERPVLPPLPLLQPGPVVRAGVGHVVVGGQGPQGAQVRGPAARPKRRGLAEPGFHEKLVCPRHQPGELRLGVRGAEHRVPAGVARGIDKGGLVAAVDPGRLYEVAVGVNVQPDLVALGVAQVLNPADKRGPSRC